MLLRSEAIVPGSRFPLYIALSFSNIDGFKNNGCPRFKPASPSPCTSAYGAGWRDPRSWFSRMRWHVFTAKKTPFPAPQVKLCMVHGPNLRARRSGGTGGIFVEQQAAGPVEDTNVHQYLSACQHAYKLRANPPRVGASERVAYRTLARVS